MASLFRSVAMTVRNFTEIEVSLTTCCDVKNIYSVDFKFFLETSRDYLSAIYCFKCYVISFYYNCMGGRPSILFKKVKILEAVYIDDAEISSIIDNIVFTRLNAPSVYFKLGIVDPAFMCFFIHEAIVFLYSKSYRHNLFRYICYYTYYYTSNKYFRGLFKVVFHPKGNV